MNTDYLTFLHLSDIHFQKKEIPYDLDNQVRDELENDLRLMLDQVKKINGILITGDIVFSGKDEEYIKARDWIEKIAKIIECEIEDIWLVPGNHDVDRSIIKESIFIQDIHKNIRILNNQNEIDKKLEKYAKDRDGRLLLEALTSYSKFAIAFGCPTKPQQCYWETKGKNDYILNDGSKLRLRGINSAIISDDLDNDGDYRLVVGSNQFNLANEDGVVYLIMCHHPPEWTRDRDEFQRFLIAKAQIQLFGHKHEQEKFLINNKCIRLHSGAVHPSKEDSRWQPIYNVLSIRVNNQNKRELEVKINQREWDFDNKEFKPSYNYEEKKEFFNYLIPLKPWEMITNNKITENKNTSTKMEDEINSENQNIYKRRLAYHFLSLPYNIIVKIASELELIKNEDSNLPVSDVYSEYFKRVEMNKQLDILWDKVSQYRPNIMEKVNPFRK